MVNLQFPMASSSEVGCNVGVKTATRSFFTYHTQSELADISKKVLCERQQKAAITGE